MSELRAWGVEWHSRNLLDGEQRYLQWRPSGEPNFTLFQTRREARTYIEQHYGYIRRRPDLQAEPFGWRVPQAVPVVVRRRSTFSAEEPE